jgi:adenine-specific DNA-methyltransferase
MAAIEDLIKQIADPGLREQLAAEVARLKATKKFGLVFEEHLPELLRLPGLPARAGTRVLKKDEHGCAAYRVLSTINGQKVKIVPEAGGPEEIVARESVVVAKAFGEPMYPALVLADAIERSPGKPWHVLINADNYHALQLLLYGYEGKVDVIYIDPPYNTGARDWKYNNDYVDKTDRFRHSKWLSMMKKRLELAKRLLTPGGVFLCAIDDHECHTLRSLMDQIFGEQNLLGVTCVEVNPAGQNIRENAPAISHDYFVAYANDIEKASIIPRALREKEMTLFDECDEEGRFLWDNLRRRGGNSRPADRPGQWYPLYVTADSGEIALSATPDSVEVWPIDPKGIKRIWRVSPDGFTREYEKGNVSLVRKAGRLEIVMKSRMPEGRKPKTLWHDSLYSATSYGTRFLHSILGEQRFTYPKSLYLVMDSLRYWARKDAIILDFFAGSGTTFHATAMLNFLDDGSRRTILVTNNEVEEKMAKSLIEEGYSVGQGEFDRHGICDAVTWPRCKFAIAGKRSDGTKLPGETADGRPLSKGLAENAAYFKLEFLDPADVTRGVKFESIVPILWLLAGCRGACELSQGTGKWFVPKANPFAVLLKEDAFAEFLTKLAERPDIDHAFLVTDSTEAFHEMAAELGRGYKSIQLYRSYIDTFRINLTEPGTITPGGVPAIPLSVALLAPPAQEVSGAV